MPGMRRPGRHGRRGNQGAHASTARGAPPPSGWGARRGRGGRRCRGGSTPRLCGRSRPPAAPATVEVGGASRCEPNNLLSQLKDDIPYSQVSLLHNQLLAVRYLNLWVVYPDLNSAPAADEVEANHAQATELAARLSHLLLNDHPCVRVSFEQITMTIVDSRYNAWFVGCIGMEDIPSGSDLAEEENATLT